MSKPVQVTDGSQKVKIFLMVLFLGAFAVYGSLLLKALNTKSLKGVGDFASYGIVIPTTVGCSTAGNTVVEATNTARTSFIVSNNSTNTIFICKSGTCAVNAGILLTTTTGGNPTYEQIDSYIGTWSCAALNGTSTLSVQKSP